jgi:hypothetical protein
VGGAGGGRIAIFVAASTHPGDGATSLRALLVSFRETIVSPSAWETCVMQQMRTLLSSAPSRIGRRLALLVAIAAASLPDAGA